MIILGEKLSKLSYSSSQTGGCDPLGEVMGSFWWGCSKPDTAILETGKLGMGTAILNTANDSEMKGRRKSFIGLLFAAAVH